MKTFWFIFYRDNLLLEKCDEDSYSIPYCEDSPIDINEGDNIRNISPFNGTDEVKAISVNSPLQIDCDKYEICGLRESYYKLSRELYLEAGKCREILYWDQNTKYCGVCGAPMKLHTDISKCCTKCGKEVWPQLATAVIVLVHRGDEVLLVHAKNFRSNFYGLVAGFVETGETLEQAVMREVKEETGLTIKNLRYFSSQPWPYPCGLMVGFFAEYESGDIRLQFSELAAGGWYHHDNLPTIPEKLSIARKLIDYWLDTFNKQ